MKNADKLVGKTIESVRLMKHKDYIDEPYMELTFTDGSTAWLDGGYGSYQSGKKVMDEYPCYIQILSDSPTSTDLYGEIVEVR